MEEILVPDCEKIIATSMDPCAIRSLTLAGERRVLIKTLVVYFIMHISCTWPGNACLVPCME